MTIKVNGTLGRHNGGPLKPVVMVEGDVDWLSTKQARQLAARLTKAADLAEEKAEKLAARCRDEQSDAAPSRVSRALIPKGS